MQGKRYYTYIAVFLPSENDLIMQEVTLFWLLDVFLSSKTKEKNLVCLVTDLSRCTSRCTFFFLNFGEGGG